MAVRVGFAVTYTLVTPIPGPTFVATNARREYGKDNLDGAPSRTSNGSMRTFLCWVGRHKWPRPRALVGGIVRSEEELPTKTPFAFYAEASSTTPRGTKPLSTVLTLLADNERWAYLKKEDIGDWIAIQTTLNDELSQSTPALAESLQVLPAIKNGNVDSRVTKHDSSEET